MGLNKSKVFSSLYKKEVALNKLFGYDLNTMRTAVSNEVGIRLNVVEHIMTRNLWEFYITDKKASGDIVEALVMGHETEIGDVSLSEIKPYITMRTTDLSEIMPPEGYNWED